MLSLSRLKDVGEKAWHYILGALERPLEIPLLLKLVTQGVHIGEYRKLGQRWIRDMNIETVVDVGANTGQFSSAVRAVLPGVAIYAFEPLPDCCTKLTARLGVDGHFTAFQVALGDSDGTTEFRRSSFAKSSSILRMTELHRGAFPWTASETLISVPVARLDDYLNKIELKPNILLKIDVQGYENRVLRGAPRFLDHVSLVIVEVSFQPLYDKQATFEEVHEILVHSGFLYRGVIDQLLSPIDGTVLQADAIFLRQRKI